VPGLPRVSGKTVVAALRQGGFETTHIRGSHHYLRKPGQGGLVVVPVHGNRDLPLGTLSSILRQAELTEEEFRQLLDA
jgi:predicted RNA binding protein YcfA (HicA-like mRNA interferase family)